MHDTPFRGKLHSKIIISDLIIFFLMVKVRGRNSNGKMVKQTAKKKMARASVCDASGATSSSCKVTRANRNVHDQPESVRR